MTALAVVPVSFAGGAPRAVSMVEDAVALFADWSGGAFRPDLIIAPPVHVAEPAHRFAALGGMTRLGGPALAARAGIRAPMLLVAAGPFHPHCWRVPLAAGGGQYVLLPAGASALTAAHELGHLLLGWADHPAAGRHCLMGAGTGPPGAWLRVAAGWAVPRPFAATDTPAMLGGIGRRGGLLVERAEGVLLAWSGANCVAAVRLAEGDHDRPMLALLAAQGVHPEPWNTRNRELSP